MCKAIRFLLLAVTGFVAFTVVQYPAARAGDILYGIDFTDHLLQINPTTGAGTVIGPLDSHMFPYGLGVTSGNLYTYDQVAEVVRQLDPATGHTLATINIGTPGLVGEGDITFNSAGTGYLATGGAGGQNIVSFDLAKGTSAVIGPQSVFLDGLAFSSSGVFYGLSQGNGDPNGGSSLYTINPTTAVMTLVGTLNVPAAKTEILGGLAFAPDGTLYAELSDGSTNSSLYTVNVATGQATLVGNIGDINVSGIRFLSSASSVPEPSSIVLAGAGIAALVAFRLIRPKRAPR